MAWPSAASWRHRRLISARAPTSTPRVGSTRSRTRDLVASHRAIWTFCWLPPLSVPTSVSTEGALISSACDQLPARRSIAARSTKPRRVNAGRLASTILSAMERSCIRAWRRSWATRPRPARIASPGEPIRRTSPWIRTRPRIVRATPRRSRAALPRSRRPAGRTGPGSRPGARVKLMPSTCGGRRSSTSRTTQPLDLEGNLADAAELRRAPAWRTFRPTIASTIDLAAGRRDCRWTACGRRA